MNESTRNAKGTKSRYSILALFVFALLSITLSFMGEWMSAKGDQWIDYLLKAVSYLALGGFERLEESSTASTLIRAGRVMAVVFVITAAGVVLDEIFHAAAAFRRWKISKSEHDLVIGLGWHGQELLKNTPAPRMIAIDPTPDTLAKDLCKRRAIPLIEGDASDEDILRLAGIHNVRRVFIATGSDDRNIEIAHAIAMKTKASNRRIDLAICLQDKKSIQTLQGVLGNDSHIDLHTFNSSRVTTQALFSSEKFRIDRFENTPNKEAHLILIGGGTMAWELLSHSLKYCIFEKEATLTIDVLCADSTRFAQSWCAEFPCYAQDEDGVFRPTDKIWLQEKVLPEIRFHDLPSSERGQIDWCESLIGDKQCITTVIVAMPVPSDSCVIFDTMGATLSNLADLHRKDIEIWVYFNSRKASMRTAIQTSLENRYGRLKPRIFFDYLENFDADLAIGDKIEKVAKRINAMYAIPGIEKLAKPQEEIDKTWRATTESDKDSSRQSAVYAFIKKKIKTRLMGNEESQRKQLTEIEHRRWCAEYLLKGYKPLTQNVPFEQLSDNDKSNIEIWFTNKAKKQFFKEQRLHVDLVPFHDLPKLLGKERGEKEQDKDYQISLLDWVINVESTTQ